MEGGPTQNDRAMLAYGLFHGAVKGMRETEGVQKLYHAHDAYEMGTRLVSLLPEGVLEKLCSGGITQEVLDELNATAPEGIRIIAPEDEEQRRAMRNILVLLRFPGFRSTEKTVPAT